MTTLRLQELAEIAAGELHGADAEFSRVSIDTRTLQAGDLFFAIPGERFDGHDFVGLAAAAGAVGAVVEHWVDAEIPQILVASVRVALGQLGSSWRLRSGAKVVGVTGSNGKTSAKEMVGAILGVHAPVLKTRGNLNNDLGVPLTLMQLSPEHRYAVIEMGANHAGEIAYVAGLAKPEVGLITNAGAAHLEGFGSRDGVASAKGEMISSLRSDGVAILNADDHYFDYWRGLAGSRRMISFGFSGAAQVRGIADSVAVAHGPQGFETRFAFEYAGQRHEGRIQLAGRHNVANALAAAAACLALNIDMEQVLVGIAQLQPVPGRMQPAYSRHHTLFINDTYNANPSSFQAALDVLIELPGQPWVVLGSFAELGEESAEIHADVGRLAKAKGVTRLWATGPHADKAVEAFGAGAEFYPEMDELIRKLEENLSEDAVILVKGSRSQRMERVIEAFCRVS